MGETGILMTFKHHFNHLFHPNDLPILSSFYLLFKKDINLRFLHSIHFFN